MAISLHPYITGVAHRIGYLEQLYAHVLARPGVLMWTGGQVYDWYVAESGLRRSLENSVRQRTRMNELTIGQVVELRRR